MKVRFSCGAALSAALFFGSGAWAGPPVIDPPPLGAFKAGAWGGMTLGTSTRDDIKKNYATRGAKGDDKFLRAGALILTPPDRDDDGDVKAIQALVDGTRGDAKLTGIRIVYGDFAPYIKDLTREWGDPPQKFYAPKRYSDWYIAAFPQRGVALITTDGGGAREESVQIAFLTTPRRLQDALNGYSQTPTDISDITQDFALESDKIVVGGADVSVNIDGMDVWGEDFMRDDIKRQIRDRLYRAHVDVQRGQDGSATFNVNISYKDNDGGSVSCSANVNGNVIRRDGPQSVSITGNGFQSLPKSRNDAERNLKSKIQSAINSMITNLDQNARAAVKKLQPPTPESYRKSVWDKLISDATK